MLLPAVKKQKILPIWSKYLFNLAFLILKTMKKSKNKVKILKKKMIGLLTLVKKQKKLIQKRKKMKSLICLICDKNINLLKHKYIFMKKLFIY